MTGARTIASADYIRRETTLSIAINMVFSLAFFMLVFGRQERIAVWGVGGYAVDVIPQSFAVALMSVLVPGALAARKLRAQEVGRGSAPSRLPARRSLRALILAAAASVVAIGICWPLLALTGLDQLAWWPALIAKIAIGGLVAWAITPVGLRAELTR